MTFAEFQESLVYYFKEQDIKAVVKPIDDKTIDVDLFIEAVDDEDDDPVQNEPFYVGNYADPGLRIEWLGEHKVRSADTDSLVRVNSIIMSAFPKHVVGWALGFEG